jgi:hypothetical protein
MPFQSLKKFGGALAKIFQFYRVHVKSVYISSEKPIIPPTHALMYGIPVSLDPFESRTGNVTGRSRLCGSGTPFLFAILLPECIALGQCVVPRKATEVR